MSGLADRWGPRFCVERPFCVYFRYGMQRTARVQVAWPSRGGAQLAGRTFTIRSLQDFLNLSRGALRHYESIGLLVPERDEESGYRIYSNKDAYKILDYIIYQNAGGAARDARELLVDDGVDAAKFVDCCQNEVERRIAWYRAVRESLDRLAAIGRGECTGAPRLVMDDVWWLYYDRGEKGYGSFEANEALDILLDGMPISSLGAVFDGDLFTQGLEGTRWYRAVPERHVDLFPRLRELGYEYRRLGGGLHIVATYTEVVGTGRGFDDTYGFVVRLRRLWKSIAWSCRHAVLCQLVAHPRGVLSRDARARAGRGAVCVGAPTPAGTRGDSHGAARRLSLVVCCRLISG